MDVEFISHSRDFKKRKIIPYRGDIEPHEALLDKLAQRKEEEIGLSSKKFEVPLSKKLLGGFLLASIVLILFLFAKTFQMQVLEPKRTNLLFPGFRRSVE